MITNKHFLLLTLSVFFTNIVFCQDDLIHYWHFNNLPNDAFYEVEADFTLHGDVNISYDGTGDGYMDAVDDGSDLNTHMGQLPGTALRVRNPSDTRELIIDAPTTGYENINLSYAVKRTTNGPRLQNLYYSEDGGNSWNNHGSPYDIYEEYNLIEFNFAGFGNIDNNSDLLFKIVFEGDHTTGNQGNNRFDNLAIKGDVINQDVYYSKPEGMLNDLNTWGTNTDGSGDSPTSFEADNTVFYIYNRETATIDDNWSVNGIGTYVVAGNGTEETEFTVPDNHAFDGTINVSAKGSLILQNSDIPNMANLDPLSKVVFEQTGYTTTVPALSYGELHLKKEVKSLSGSIIVNGLFRAEDVTIDPGLNLELYLKGDLEYIDVSTDGPQNINMIIRGDKDQVFSGNGNEIGCYNFNVDKPGGSLTLDNNTSIYARNNFRLDFWNNAVFYDGGNYIRLDDDLRLNGDDASNFNLEGTIILTAPAGTNDFEYMVAELNNLIIDVTNEAKPDFNMAIDTVFIKNDLSISSTSNWPILLRDVVIDIGGNFEIAVNSQNQIEKGSSRIVFSGEGEQTITNNGYSGHGILNGLHINKDNGDLLINDDITFDGNITFDKGIIQYTGEGILKAGPDALVSNHSQDSYIIGPMGAYIKTGINTKTELPIGSNDLFRPVELYMTLGDGSKTNKSEPKLFVMEFIDEAPPEGDLPDDLESILNNYHYDLSSTDNYEMLDAQIRLEYDETDNIGDPAFLRIAQFTDGAWVNIGGIGSAPDEGHVISSQNFTSTGIFALAISDEAITEPIMGTQGDLDSFVAKPEDTSLPQSFSIHGYNLTNDINIEVPSPFLISLEDDPSFSSSISISHVNGTVDPTDIYVVYNPQETGTHEEQITITTDGLESLYIDIIGISREIPKLYINEFMAVNTSTIEDPFGDYLGWIEIFNPNDQEVDLGGYYLSNDHEEPLKYQLPQGEAETLIPAQSFLLLWTGGNEEQSAAHLNFSIPHQGGMISLYGPEGAVLIDEINYGWQNADESYGRENDGADGWIYFSNPTPGESNISTNLSELTTKNKLNVYPNPVHGNTIHLNKPVSAKLLSVNGHVILDVDNTKQINIANIKPGIYFLKTDKGHVAKIIIK